MLMVVLMKQLWTGCLGDWPNTIDTFMGLFDYVPPNLSDAVNAESPSHPNLSKQTTSPMWIDNGASGNSYSSYFHTFVVTCSILAHL